jgi:hypothetical protein
MTMEGGKEDGKSDEHVNVLSVLKPSVERKKRA